MNLEMAITEEMLAIAGRIQPTDCCLVPERREELTTEGGLDVAGDRGPVAETVEALAGAGIRVSLFIEPDPLGRYLYTEASGGCDSSTAMLYTPCLDLSGSYRPSASIWYHMRSSQNVIGKLMVDIYDGERWHLNVNGSIAGAQGSYWQELVTPLDSFATDTIVIRYRGKTGSDYQSDIALDDWSLNETSQTSLAEAARKALRIYPNPSKGLFYLQRGALLEGPTQLVVRSASGQRIQAKQWSGEEKRHELDLSHLPAGVYMLEIRAPEQQHTYRLVLQ